MKALFKSHFPFVEGVPESELTPEQLITKQTYDKLYTTDSVLADPYVKEKIRPNTKAKAETDRLREVHGNDEPATAGGKE